MKCLLLLVSTISYLIVCSAEFTKEADILTRCKYIRCKNVSDLKREAHIRQCIATTCSSNVLNRQSLADICKSECIDATKHDLDTQDDDPEGPETILDYSWLD